MCQIWWSCGESKGFKNAKSEIIFAVVKLRGGKFKDCNRATAIAQHTNIYYYIHNYIDIYTLTSAICVNEPFEKAPFIIK